MNNLQEKNINIIRKTGFKICRGFNLLASNKWFPLFLVADPSNIYLSSKSKIETLEKGVKYIQRYQQKYQNAVIEVVLVFLLLSLNIFHTFSSVSIAALELINVSWRGFT